MSRVQSIERAFEVMGALADGAQGVTAIAVRVGLPKSSVARLLRALQAEEAVEQAADGRYRLGPRIPRLAGNLRPARSLVALARPHLEALAAATGEVAGLSIPDGRDVLYIDQVDSPHPVSIRDWTGTRIPMHEVSSGQVFLAGLAPAALDAYFAVPLERSTGHTITDPDALRSRLAQVRAAGFGWVRDEFADGISSVASGVSDTSGVVVAALHVHGPSYRFPQAGREAEIGRLVAETAARMADTLRHSA